MSENVETSQPEQTEAPEYSPAEVKAMERGWVPKDQFEADERNAGKKWREADEFNDRGELFEKIEELSKKAKNAQKALDQLSEHHKKVKETEYQRALSTLKVQKKAALEDGDADALIAIDERIADVKEQQRKEITPKDSEVPVELEQWVAKNKWYEKDSEMAADADAIGISYKNKFPNKEMSEVLTHVETQIKKLYPEKFENPNKPKTGLVQSSSTTRPTRSSGGYQLSEEEERVARNFERQGIMTREEYVKEIKALNAKGR